LLAPIAGIFRSDWVGSPAFQHAETLPDGRRYRIAKITKGDVGAYNNTAEVVALVDHCFVLGDNRDNSSDSRDPIVGVISRDDIIARGYVIYWSAKHDRIAAALD
jgi:signal peptidase I